MATIPSSLVYKVERNEPELITPSKPTPYEFKLLSDIDDQKGFRIYMPTITFYRNAEGMKGKDPVKTIKEAIAKTLVYYYPLAGRLREGLNDKLMVECTGEGVLFIEANANVRLDQFGDVLVPPFPGGDDLLYDLHSSADMLDSPLVLIQVTRLMCGGFIFGLRFTHVMTDATGILQFMKAIGEIARGAHSPSVQPVWKREYLNARNPPQITCQHRAFDKLTDIQGMSLQDMGQWPECSYFFGQQELARLRNQVQPHLSKSSKFEILFACLWRCRTIALNINPEEDVRAAFPVNASRKFNPPVGFYGNTIASAVAQSSSGKLCQNPLSYALELINKAKDEVMTEEFMRSLADFLVQNGRPQMTMARTFYVTDLTRIGFKDVDYGWGKAVYGGALWGARPSLFTLSKNDKGEDGILVTIRLPPTTIERFFIEIDKMVKVPKQTIMSSL